MLSNYIIQRSSSPWASPVVLVKKKDGTWRFGVDNRHLNATTKKDVYPLPRIGDALDCLHGAKYFSSIDLRSGYGRLLVMTKIVKRPHSLYRMTYTKVLAIRCLQCPSYLRMSDGLPALRLEMVDMPLLS